ncbi:MAG: 16S rRNA (guanine(527)-N(7))-methyltransferase RsmG [Candidatus Obscuribacterales bacterium]|jgi:16S rRNA (guanine527-N7)-methyltransferase
MAAEKQTATDSESDLDATNHLVPNSDYEPLLKLLRTHPALDGLELDEQRWQLLDRFCGILAAYNEKVNLVANTTPEVLVNRHILDGLTVASNIYKSKVTSGKLIDIGSGGGLPAMVIAIACPDLAVTMVDSVGKKVKFLNEASQELGLVNNIALTARAEELARVKGERASYDLATARAVGTLTLTIELCLPFLKRNGLYMAQKTVSRLDEELKDAKAMMRELECRVEQTKLFTDMPGVEDSVILLIRKIETTPHYYPRPWAKIKASK